MKRNVAITAVGVIFFLLGLYLAKTGEQPVPVLFFAAVYLSMQGYAA